jgi:hypothetical protein
MSAILGVCMVVAVDLYPKLGVGDCGRGGEAPSPCPGGSIAEKYIGDLGFW